MDLSLKLCESTAPPKVEFSLKKNLPKSIRDGIRYPNIWRHEDFLENSLKLAPMQVSWLALNSVCSHNKLDPGTSLPFPDQRPVTLRWPQSGPWNEPGRPRFRETFLRCGPGAQLFVYRFWSGLELFFGTPPRFTRNSGDWNVKPTSLPFFYASGICLWLRLFHWLKSEEGRWELWLW